MSIIIKSFKPAHLLRGKKLLALTQARHGSHWLPDYKPGPVPKTEEERLLAAKKYNLLPEEYEPHEEGEGPADYPRLPLESVDSRDPWYPWDNQELRKDFNEPVNTRMVICLPEMLSTTPPETPHWKAVLYCLGLIGLTMSIIGFLYNVKILYPVAEKQYPKDGVVHYTFEVAHSNKH